MTDDEIIAVVQAHKEGKKIQLLDSSYGYPVWRECIEPNWNFGTGDYRVAPEPRKPREWLLPIGAVITVNSNGLISYTCNDPMMNNPLLEYVKVREVTE